MKKTFALLSMLGLLVTNAASAEVKTGFSQSNASQFLGLMSQAAADSYGINKPKNNKLSLKSKNSLKFSDIKDQYAYIEDFNGFSPSSGSNDEINNEAAPVEEVGLILNFSIPFKY